MQLTVHTDYALRTLLYLGSRPEEVVSVSRLSDVYGVSRHHLEKVAKTLVRLGLLRSRRGKLGGVQLAKRAEGIHIGEVVRQTEPNIALLACFNGERKERAPCVLTSDCELKRALLRARDTFFATLDEYSLADLLLHTPGVAALSPQRHLAQT